ncbi:MAG: hypothetical protein JWP87_1537 [Labilithrix sp.]|nr:hypothetical protein [Labilithrix sp.]
MAFFGLIFCGCMIHSRMLSGLLASMPAMYARLAM